MGNSESSIINKQKNDLNQKHSANGSTNIQGHVFIFNKVNNNTNNLETIISQQKNNEIGSNIKSESKSCSPSSTINPIFD
jgi:hypothetical protein